jgi:hypothetical protein
MLLQEQVNLCTKRITCYDTEKINDYVSYNATYDSADDCTSGAIYFITGLAIEPHQGIHRGANSAFKITYAAAKTDI